MSPIQLLDDDAIEAIVHERPVDPRLAALVAFSRQVRAVGEGPVPPPSPALASLLAGPATTGTVATPTARMPALRRRGVSSARAGGHRGPAARLAVGTALAVVGVVGAGAAGILPAAANDTVRDAIEAVTPVNFPHDEREPVPAGEAEDPGPAVPPATTGAPGQDPSAGGGPGAGPGPHPGSVAPDEPPGETGDTGLTRANETPAAPHAPDTVPPGTAPGQIDPDPPGGAQADGRAQDDPSGSDDPGDAGGTGGTGETP